jgi:hypothetical protein
MGQVLVGDHRRASANPSFRAASWISTSSSSATQTSKSVLMIREELPFLD